MGTIDFLIPCSHFQHKHGDMRCQRTVSCVVTAVLRHWGSGCSSNTPCLPPSTDLSGTNILFYLKKKKYLCFTWLVPFLCTNTVESLWVYKGVAAQVGLCNKLAFLSSHWCERATLICNLDAIDFISSSLLCPNSWPLLHTKIICHSDMSVWVWEGRKRWRGSSTSMSMPPPCWSLKNTSRSLQMLSRYVRSPGFKTVLMFYLGPSRKYYTAQWSKAGEEEKLVFNFFLQRHRI